MAYLIGSDLPPYSVALAYVWWLEDNPSIYDTWRDLVAIVRRKVEAKMEGREPVEEPLPAYKHLSKYCRTHESLSSRMMEESFRASDEYWAETFSQSFGHLFDRDGEHCLAMIDCLVYLGGE